MSENNNDKGDGVTANQGDNIAKTMIMFASIGFAITMVLPIVSSEAYNIILMGYQVIVGAEFREGWFTNFDVPPNMYGIGGYFLAFLAVFVFPTRSKNKNCAMVCLLCYLVSIILFLNLQNRITALQDGTEYPFPIGWENDIGLYVVLMSCVLGALGSLKVLLEQ